MGSFKAIELNVSSRQRTGREHALECESRQDAVDELLRRLGVHPAEARVDPTRTIVHVGETLWTIVGLRAPTEGVAPSLRRGGAKHKNVR
jgi:hypothetical protein